MLGMIKPSEIDINKCLTSEMKKQIRPICVVKGGKNKNRVIYYYPQEIVSVLNNSNRLSNIGLFNIENNLEKDISVPTMLQQLPFGHERDCLFICGPSGSGKSYKVSEYCNMFKKSVVKKHGLKAAKNIEQIYLISPKIDDKNINKIKNIEQFDLTYENFVDEDEKLTCEDLEDSLVIFDDIEAISNTAVRDGVRELRDNILLLGRSMHIYCVVTNHLTLDRKNTRIPLLECQFYTYFPGSGTNRQNVNFFKTYCGFDSETIKKLLNLKSRSVTIHTHYPQYVLCKDRVCLLETL